MKVEILNPVDAPSGKNRLFALLRSLLSDPTFCEFRMIVAFAKVGPLLRLEDALKRWRAKKNVAEAIFGIDLMGTSKQALQQSLSMFGKVYITNSNVPNCTFHPKMYLFKGETAAVAIVGSHNMTVGGLETNFEAGVVLRFQLPSEAASWEQAAACWNDLLPPAFRNTIHLTPALLATLEARGELLLEGITPSRIMVATRTSTTGPASPFPPAPPSAPTPIRRSRPTGGTNILPAPRVAAIAPPATTVQGLVIQIIPHRNGEVFLSKLALNEHPEFFGYPFTGSTTPKKTANRPYPQRQPDPAVQLTIYDVAGAVQGRFDIPSLNMVYYTTKADIRITLNPTLASRIPPYSVLVMREAPPHSGLDYTLEVFLPGSPAYSSYLASCTISLPSGGKARARRMGWI